jgi:hypothetical protein
MLCPDDTIQNSVCTALNFMRKRRHYKTFFIYTKILDRATQNRKQYLVNIL